MILEPISMSLVSAAVAWLLSMRYFSYDRDHGTEVKKIYLIRLVWFGLLLAGCGWASAASFVYVSNAEDGDIGTYRLQADGRLLQGPRVPAGNLVMPMAVSTDRKYLFAALLSKPYLVITYQINRSNGELERVSTAPLAEAYPYISVDRSGRFLMGASYGGHQVGVNAIGNDGKVSAPIQTVATARNAHAIITDRSNQFAFAPHLGTDQIFQFRFDSNTGRLALNSPAAIQLKSNTGPRHLVVSANNQFVYLLNEFSGTVTSLRLDARTGLLTETGSVSALPPDSRLTPGAPRDSSASAGITARNIEQQIWASDLHLSPDGRHLFAAERTGSTISVLKVDESTGALQFQSSTPVERQPRGFAIDPSGKYLVVAGEKSETISVYSIDAASAELGLLAKYPTGKGSNWVQIVAGD